MFFIDGEKLPSINGTGTEDYFLGAWNFRNTFILVPELRSACERRRTRRRAIVCLPLPLGFADPVYKFAARYH